MIERRFEEDDLQNILELLRSAFDGWHDDKYWAWKYQRNPHGSPMIWVAEDKGRIVGCYILNPVRIRIGRNSVIGAQSVDAAVDSAFRGTGIFKRLVAGAVTSAAKEGIALICAFPSEIAYKGQVRLGYFRPVFIIPKMFKVLRTSSLLKDHSLGGLFLGKFKGLIKPLQRVGNIEPSFKTTDDMEVRKVDNFDSRFEAYWAGIKEKNTDILVERDRAYLEWRYTEHPEKQYAIYVCERHDQIIGHVVLSVERNASSEKGKAGSISMGNIIDMLTLPNMTDAGYLLVSASCNHFERKEVDVARCWMLGWHPFHKILRKFGFSEHYELLRRAILRPRYAEQFICRVNSKVAIQEAMASVGDRNKPRWFITQGDADYT